MTDEYSAQERAALAAFWLMQGNRLTTAEIQRLTGFQTWQGAWLMMGRISRVLPLIHADGSWRLEKGGIVDD